ncbi:hypothetical protein CAEBREN_11101 [Caenorhabditis brenneri]|uniref:T-box domain-containing protein n=1 Tax=Caenorhabditis brenneri TaxID=135651 RepID=G0MBD3_CAEBE|nr:hypothetical protein CAEBREN_11101 [Caenorhabditis brenneri]
MLNQILASLHKPQDEQWIHFNRNSPQMIVTKTGRRIHPALVYEVRGLQPDKYFAMMLTFEQTAGVHSNQKLDEPAGRNNNQERPKPVWHVYGVKNGEYWMSYPINFSFVELTTNFETKNPFQVPLIPGRKYIPMLSIFESPLPYGHPNVANQYLKSFRIPHTEFTAVALFKHNGILPKRKNGMSSEEILGNWKQSKSQSMMSISNAVRSPEESAPTDVSTPFISVPNPPNTSQPIPENAMQPQNGATSLNMLLNQFSPPNNEQSSSTLIPPPNSGFLINNLLSTNRTSPNPLVPIPGIPPSAFNSPIVPQNVPPQPNLLTNNLLNPLLSQMLLSMANPLNLNLILNTIANLSSSNVPPLNFNPYPIAPPELLAGSDAPVQPDPGKEQEEEEEEINVVD